MMLYVLKMYVLMKALHMIKSGDKILQVFIDLQKTFKKSPSENYTYFPFSE